MITGVQIVRFTLTVYEIYLLIGRQFILNRVETFDEKYMKVVEEMNVYLRDNGLDMISWTDDKGNTFKIRLSKKFFQSTKDRNGSP